MQMFTQVASYKLQGVREIYTVQVVRNCGVQGKKWLRVALCNMVNAVSQLAVVGGASYICAPVVAVITDATLVVKSCKVLYTSVSYVMKVVEDASHISFLPVDLALFSQPISVNKDGRFSSQSNHYKPLDRVVITRDVNKVMREVSNQLPGKLNITSHSFRIGYITQLWKDSKDIEFVKQIIGHRNLDTTSAYVNKLSDQERQKRIDQLK